MFEVESSTTSDLLSVLCWHLGFLRRSWRILLPAAGNMQPTYDVVCVLALNGWCEPSCNDRATAKCDGDEVDNLECLEVSFLERYASDFQNLWRDTWNIGDGSLVARCNSCEEWFDRGERKTGLRKSWNDDLDSVVVDLVGENGCQDCS